jgi:hypothetical protein
MVNLLHAGNIGGQFANIILLGVNLAWAQTWTRCRAWLRGKWKCTGFGVTTGLPRYRRLIARWSTARAGATIFAIRSGSLM